MNSNLTSGGVPSDSKAFPAEEESIIHEILVPTDLTGHSKPALKYAISLAGRYHAKIVLLNVAQFPASSSIHTPFDPDEMINAARQSLNQIATTIPSDVSTNRPFDLEPGIRRSKLLKKRATVQRVLIVITTHGYRGIERVLHGSKAEAVIRHAPCPVLVVRPVEGSGFERQGAVVRTNQNPIATLDCENPLTTLP